jgi:recombination DNA repair RAD52 pathway protein
MKTLAEIQEALGKRYAGNTREINGMTYIPWNDTVKQANEVFGHMGWSSEVREFKPILLGDGSLWGFQAVVRVAVTAYDEGVATTTFHDGVGSSDEIRETGRGKLMIDMAIKAAESDALSRAFKKFGEAFGLHLYDKETAGAEKSSNTASAARPATPYTKPTTTTAPKSSTSGGKGKPTERMASYLVKLGVPEDVIPNMSFETASAVIGALKGGADVDETLEEHGLVEAAF